MDPMTIAGIAMGTLGIVSLIALIAINVYLCIYPDKK